MKKLFTLLCFFVTMNLCAQEWETLGTQTWVYEWRTMSEPFLGPAQTDETGAFKIYVRSEAQALAAGNMLENDGHIARWDSQCFITFGEENALKIGDVLSISFSIKADAATTITTQSDTAPGTYLHWAAIGDVDASTSWEEFSREVTVTGENNTLVAGTYSIAFNLSDGQENNIYIKDIVLKVKRGKEEKEISWANIIVNSDLSGGDMSCFYQKVYPQAEASQSTATDGAIVINCPAKVDDPWDSEFYIMLPQILPAGTKFKVRFNCKASAPTTITPQCYNAPLQYIHWKCFDDVPFSTEWTTFETTAVVPDACDGSDHGGYKNDFRSIKFNLTKDQDITYYFDNIVVSVDEEIAVNPQPFPWEEMMIEGYQAKAFYDFSTNIPEVLPTSGDLCYRKEFGLYNFVNGNRSATVSIPVEENDILVLKYNTKSNGYININYGTPNEALTALSGYQVFDITTTADDITFTIGRQSWIGAALVMKKDPNAKVANYTVNYLDEEYQPLREAAIRPGIVGSPIVLSESDKQPLFNEGETQKYLYKSDNANELTVASDGSTQVNIIFRKAEKYAWTATALMGSQTGYTTSGETWEGDKALVPYPRYQLLDGKLWEKATTNKEYRQYFVITENNQEFILDYTETEIEDVVFLAEIEDIDGMSVSNHDNTYVRCSQGRAGFSASGFTTLVSSLPLGKYRIQAGLFSGKNASTEFTFTSSGRTIWNPTTNSGNVTDMSNEVVLPHDVNSILLGEGNTSAAVDYVYIQYIGVPTDEEIAEAIAGENSNYFIDFAAGSYYIIDAETDMKMAAGGSFGTQGIVNDLGLDLWLTPYTESRTVTIDSRVSNGGYSHFLSQNLFMDSEEWGWGLLYQGFGFYIKDPNSGKYINIDEDNSLVLSDTPREWIIVSAEVVRAERMEELAGATIDDPKDATFLITAPNFNRNDQRNAEAWNVSGDCTLSTGNLVNNCAESLHSTFTISQTLVGAPKGTYQLTAQGFYRQDDGASEAAPQFFIGSKMAQLSKQAGSEANASDASASFTNGLYTIDPITFYYDGTGDLTIGIQGTAEHQWVVFDNFCLTYLSTEDIQGDDPADYELYVAGVQVTSTNAKDILGDGGTFTYDAKTKTLTINGSYTYDDWFLIKNSEIEDLTIYVANDAELHAESPDFIFYFWKSTTITGPGKLTLYGNIAMIYGAQLTIQDANIELPQTTSFAIMGNSSGEKLLVRNSNVHAKSYYLAIDKFNGGITIEDGMLDEDLRISDDGASICKTNGGDTNEVTIYDLEYVTGIKTLSDSPLKGESIYNLAGQRLSKPLKGINIQNGKKVLR